MRNFFDIPRGSRSGQAGFTLLLSALIASIVLALGASIFRLAQKELILSSVGRDSQFAFYAADTGAECALFWDIRYRYFATSTPSGVEPACDGEALQATGRSASYPQTMIFRFEPNGYCVDVSVEKTVDADTGALRSVIRADGFSTACAGISTSPRVLQRSVELRY